MECPNCKKFMDGLSMSGDDNRINHEFYCNHCHTYLTYSYNPDVTDKIVKFTKDEIKQDFYIKNKGEMI